MHDILDDSFMGDLKGTARLTGVAILSALVVVFDYSLKFSGLKIPFPWMPFLKFDFTGVPIAFAVFLYGISSGAFTSIVACFAIVLRSGDLVGAAMKGLAEFSTVLGIKISFYLPNRLRNVTSYIVGIFLRIVVMSVMNLIILPAYYGIPLNAAVKMLPMLGLFNALQGLLTVTLGNLLYGAYTKRVFITPQASNKSSL